MLAVSGSFEPAVVVVSLTCCVFAFRGKTGGLPVLGSSLLLVVAFDSLRFCSWWRGVSYP